MMPGRARGDCTVGFWPSPLSPVRSRGSPAPEDVSSGRGKPLSAFGGALALYRGLRHRFDCRSGVVAGRGHARWSARARGPLLHEQVGARLHGGGASNAKTTVGWVHRILKDGRAAGGRVQGLQRDGNPRRARLAVQVREPEVEAGRTRSRFVLCVQERVLTIGPGSGGASRHSPRPAIVLRGMTPCRCRLVNAGSLLNRLAKPTHRCARRLGRTTSNV
jgi:hypothetical protein